MTRTARGTLPILAGVVLIIAASGCATTGTRGQPLVPGRHQARVGPYAVFSNAPLAADAPALGHLQTLNRQLESHLGIRVDGRDNPIEVYILDDRPAFEHFLRFYFPGLPPRRAFFLAEGDRRLVYTYRGDRLEEDLRHEATHATLHASVADLPLWLDEGLAEYFETPESRLGLNAEHLSRIADDRAEGWSPSLVRLEGLRDVRAMTPRDYRESWAWVHLLLDGPPEGRAALLAYLADLRADPSAPGLSTRLSADAASTRLLAHLDGVRLRPALATAPPPESTVRLQDSPLLAPISGERRRGFLGRLRDLFDWKD